MNEIQKALLISYLQDNEIDIYAVNFLKGGNVSKDHLSIHYYKKNGNGWNLNTDTIDPLGNVEQRSVKATRM